MRQRRLASIRPDILHLAQDKLGAADQSIVFGGLFDAEIRSTHTSLSDDSRRKPILNEAMDRIYTELTRAPPAQVTRVPVVGQGRSGVSDVRGPLP